MALRTLTVVSAVGGVEHEEDQVFGRRGDARPRHGRPVAWPVGRACFAWSWSCLRIRLIKYDFNIAGWHIVPTAESVSIIRGEEGRETAN